MNTDRIEITDEGVRWSCQAHDLKAALAIVFGTFDPAKMAGISVVKSPDQIGASPFQIIWIVDITAKEA